MAVPAAPAPDLNQIAAAREALGDQVKETPVARWDTAVTRARFPGVELFAKLELWQHTGTFKPRGALTVMQGLDDAARARGVVAFSAGNHALAVAYAADRLGTTAKVVMPETSDPGRLAAVRAAGAEVVLVPTIAAARQRMQDIAAAEGRSFVHPFEGSGTVLGTATLGLELARQLPDLDAVIIPIGGGGLCAGVAAAIGQAQPRCRIIGVEPEGADTMSRSFAAGAPTAIDAVRTIADSLGAPTAEPYTYAVCRRFVHDLVRVSDDDLRRAMQVLFRDLKLAVEPAGAASTAAAFGPLRGELRGRVALIFCGANTDLATFGKHAAIDAAEWLAVR